MPTPAIAGWLHWMDPILSRRASSTTTKLQHCPGAGACWRPPTSTTQTHSLLQHQPLQLTTLLDQFRATGEGELCCVSASGKPDLLTLFQACSQPILASPARKIHSALTGCAVLRRCGRTGVGCVCHLVFTNNDCQVWASFGDAEELSNVSQG